MNTKISIKYVLNRYSFRSFVHKSKDLNLCIKVIKFWIFYLKHFSECIEKTDGAIAGREVPGLARFWDTYNDGY